MKKKIAIHGTYEARFEPVIKELRKQLGKYHGGAAVCVYLNGQPVVDVWAGKARRKMAWTRETMAICYSSTKAVASTAIHMLADEGLIDYDARVAEYWPEFAQNGKSAITVRQLLSHQAGLHRTTPIIRKLSDMLDWDLMVKRLAAEPPAYEPGTANGYQALTYGWLVGEIVCRVTGKTFPEFVEERISGPLELDGAYVGAEYSELGRIADTFGMPSIHRGDNHSIFEDHEPPFWMPPGPWRTWYKLGYTPQHFIQLQRHPEFWQASIPAFNGVFTARSLAKMYAVLAGGGELNGHRLMSPKTVQQASEVQTTRRDKVAIYPLHWRLGYHRADAFVKNVPEAFGHFGFGGAGAWANPELNLSAALVHNGFPFSAIAQTRVVTMTGEIYRSLGLYDGVLKTALKGELVQM